MKVFGKNNWVFFDAIYDKPCFQTYNFELLTKNINLLHKINSNNLNKILEPHA